MADNVLNARIKLKYDTLQHWTDVEGTFTPLAGEVILYYIPAQDTGHGMTRPCVAMKVGDGSTALGRLNWTQAQAGDVYSWAKKEHGVATDITSTILKNNIGNSSASANETANVQEVLTYLTQVVGTLTGGEGADESVEGKILTALSNLTLNDAAVDGQFITEVDQSNGVISVTRRALQDTDIPNISTDKLTSGTLPVSRGGTGNSSFTSGQVLIGNGTNAISTKAIDSTVTSGSNNLITSGAVATAISGLTGAMHFIGISTTAITDGGTENPTINNVAVTTKTAGDVVLYKNGTKPIGQEYVWTGTAWELLGDEGSYAIKGSITDSDFANGTTLPQSRIANLTTDLAAKQDELGFTTGTAYNKTTNPVATQSYVDNAAAAANTTYSFASGDADGEIKITPSTNGTTGTAISVKPKNLKQIATSGSIYDIEEGSNTTTTGSVKYLILDCGSATALID